MEKWYFLLFLNMINVAIIAAWWIDCTVDPEKLSHLEFRQHVAMCLLKADLQHPRILGGAASLPGDVRYDGIKHIL